MSDEPQAPPEGEEVEGLGADVDLHATRNPPVNINVATTSPANTAGATNVAPAGGSGAGATGTTNAPAGGSPTGESGVGQSTPTLTTIAPTTLARGAAVTTITYTGTLFVPSSICVLQGQALETTYVSATSLTASVNPSDSVWVAGATTAAVYNGTVASGTRPFTWT